MHAAPRSRRSLARGFTLIVGAFLGSGVTPMASANSLPGQFHQADPWYSDATGNDLGVAPQGATILIDVDGNSGTPAVVFNTPPASLLPGSPNYRLTPSRRVLYVFGSDGATGDARVSFFSIPNPPNPNLTLLSSQAIPGAILFEGFYDTGIAPDPAGPPRPTPDAQLGVSPQRIAFVAFAGTGGTISFRWFDLTTVGSTSVTFPAFNDGFDFPPRVTFSPSGTQAFVRHDADDVPDYTLIDLCPGNLGVPVTSSTGGSLFNIPGAIIEAHITSASAGTVHFEARDGATPIEGFDLPDCLCPGDPTGACCVGTACSVLTEAACTGAGGSWTEGLSCAVDSCEPIDPSGECCLGASCADLTQSACLNLGGTWTAGQSCGAASCPFPDLSVSISGPSSIESRTDFVLTLDWSNMGNAPASATEVVLTLPIDADFVSSPGGQYDAGMHNITWAIGTAGTGVSGQLQATLRTECKPLPQYTLLLNNYTIESTQTGLIGGSPALFITVTPDALASTPIGLAITSAPEAPLPLHAGDTILHTVTLTNSAPALRTGVRTTALRFGASMEFHSEVDSAGGVFGFPQPDTIQWTGDIGASQSVSLRFRTRVADCIDQGSTILNNGSGISVQTECQLSVGFTTPTDRFSLLRHFESGARAGVASGIVGPPAAFDILFPDFIVQPVRLGATISMVLHVTNNYADPATTITAHQSIPPALSLAADPFVPPTPPGASWDPTTRRVSWTGVVPVGQTVEVVFEAVMPPSGEAAISTTLSGGEPSCQNLGSRFDILPVAPLPSGPFLLGVNGFSRGLVSADPATGDTTTFMSSPTEGNFGVACTEAGEVWVAGYPAYRLDPVTLDFISPPRSLYDAAGFIGEIIVDPTDGTIVVGPPPFGSSRYTRYDPATGAITPLATGLPIGSGSDTVLDRQGRLLVATDAGRLLRFDLASPPVVAGDAEDITPIVTIPAGAPLGTQISQLVRAVMVDDAGDYVVLVETNFTDAQTTHLIDSLVRIDPATLSHTITEEQLAAFGNPTTDPSLSPLVGLGLGLFAMYPDRCGDIRLVSPGAAIVVTYSPGPPASVSGVSIQSSPFVSDSICAFPVGCPAGCIGDLTHDGATDMNDWLVFVAGFGTVAGATRDDGDLDGDGDVDVLDFAIFASDYGCVVP